MKVYVSEYKNRKYYLENGIVCSGLNVSVLVISTEKFRDNFPDGS